MLHLGNSNSKCIILATKNMRRTSRKILFAARGGEKDICQNIFEGEYSKVIQLFRIELFGTKVDLFRARN